MITHLTLFSFFGGASAVAAPSNAGQVLHATVYFFFDGFTAAEEPAEPERGGRYRGMVVNVNRGINR